MAKDQVIDVVEEEPVERDMEVTVVEAKEVGIMAKAKKHWKVIAGAAVAGVLLIGAKVLKSRKDAEAGEDFEDFDDDFDDLDESTTDTDPVE